MTLRKLSLTIFVFIALFLMACLLRSCEVKSAWAEEKKLKWDFYVKLEKPSTIFYCAPERQRCEGMKESEQWIYVGEKLDRDLCIEFADYTSIKTLHRQQNSLYITKGASVWVLTDIDKSPERWSLLLVSP